MEFKIFLKEPHFSKSLTSSIYIALFGVFILLTWSLYNCHICLYLYKTTQSYHFCLTFWNTAVACWSCSPSNILGCMILEYSRSLRTCSPLYFVLSELSLLPYLMKYSSSLLELLSFQYTWVHDSRVQQKPEDLLSSILCFACSHVCLYTRWFWYFDVLNVSVVKKMCFSEKFQHRAISHHYKSWTLRYSFRRI